MKKKISSLMLTIFVISLMLQNGTVTIFAESNTNTISGEYVLILNESLTDTQESGTIIFDDQTPFGNSNDGNSLLQATNIYIDNMKKEEQIYSNADLGIKAQVITKVYTVGDTKIMANNTKYTLRGIGEKCNIWMDDATYSWYTTENVSTAIANIIEIYDKNSYLVLKTLGADSKMNYADGSGKLSILLEQSSTRASGYFAASDMKNYNITAIHIPLSKAETSFGGYGALLAHEGQHALNASTQNFSTWINEGLSIAAMDMYYGGEDGLNWLDNCIQDLDAKSGAGLAHSSYTKNTSVDYSIPFLFLRYLNAQANKGFNANSDFYSKLYDVTSEETGINKDAYVIEQVLKQYDSFKNEDGSYWTFEQALANFRIAAFKQDDTGVNGFYGDSIVKSKIGGPALYFGQSGKSLKIEPTGGIIVKTNNGSFDIPSNAGTNIKFIPFNSTSSLPTNGCNKMIVGGKIDTTINKNEPITFDDLRIVITDSNGNYSKVYKGLKELYTDGYSLLAFRGYGAENQYNYELGTNPNDTIKQGDQLYIRSGNGVVNRFEDMGALYSYIGKAQIVDETPLIQKTITTASNNKEWGNVSGAGTYKQGTVISVNAIANPGSSFLYWSDNGIVVSTDKIYTFTTDDVDHNLIANFSNSIQDSYNVYYNGNGNTGGIVQTDSNNYKAGESVYVFNNISLVKAGYTFAGWNTRADGSGVSYNSGESLKFDSSNITLYAKWTSSLTYEYKLTAGTHSSYEDLNAVCKNEFGSDATLADWNEIKENYSDNIQQFLDSIGMEVGNGEYTKGAYVQVGGERFYTNTSFNYFIERHNGSIPETWGWVIDEIGSNYLDLYACSWYELKVLAKVPVINSTVIFDSNGGSSIGSAVVRNNSTIKEPSKPTKEGYVFDGWYKEANCVNAWSFTEDKIIGDTMLYAKWIDVADVNKDGLVSMVDLASIAINYNINNTDPKWNSSFDLNNDSIVDIFDLVICSKKIK